MDGRPHPHCDVCHHKRGRGATHKGYINSPSIQMAEWVPEGRHHTHTHTHMHAQIRQVWERPLALILVETACSSTSYHIPAEQYATLGSKCSYLMLKGLYAQHAYSQATERVLESGPQNICRDVHVWQGEKGSLWTLQPKCFMNSRYMCKH